MRRMLRPSASLLVASLLQVSTAYAAPDRHKAAAPVAGNSGGKVAPSEAAREASAEQQMAQRQQERAFAALSINKELVHVEFVHGRPQLSRSLGITPLGYVGQHATELLHGTAEVEAEARSFHNLRVGAVALYWASIATYIADLGYLIGRANSYEFATPKDQAVIWTLLGSGLVMSIVAGTLENAAMHHLGRAVALENESVVNRVLGVELKPSLSLAPIKGGAMAVAGLRW